MRNTSLTYKKSSSYIIIIQNCIGIMARLNSDQPFLILEFLIAAYTGGDKSKGLYFYLGNNFFLVQVWEYRVLNLTIGVMVFGWRDLANQKLFLPMFA